MLAISATICSPLYAQQDAESDPFMQAMIQDQKKANEKAAAEQAFKGSEVEDDTQAKQPQAYLTRPGADVESASVDELDSELRGTTGIFSEEASYNGQRVAAVDVRYISGQGTVPKSRLLDVIQTRPGNKYSDETVNDDLARLIERGLVDGDARVAVERTGSGLRVVFEVRPAGVMAGVGFTGNTRFTAEELREQLIDISGQTQGALDIRSGMAFNDRSLASARDKIIEMYNEAGYPDATVTWRYVNTSRAGYRDVYFDITEGRQVTMDHILFEGNTAFDDVRLRQVMQTKERGIFTWFTKSGRIDREVVQDDLQAVLRLYRNYGYLRAKITKVEYADNGKKTGPQRLSMRVYIDEGPRYRVRNVTFKGISVYTPEQLHPGLSMLDGDIYSLQKVSDDSRMIRDYYGAKGYADAMVRPDIDEVGVDANGVHLIDICYEVTEGGHYNVGRINVAGNTKTKQHVILREMPLKPGQPLNAVDLETAKKRLENLGYFAPGSVQVSQAASATPGYRDINVNVREQETGSVSVGFAFSSIESIYAYASVTQRNFDIMGFTNGTFVGGGQRLTISGRLGTDTQSAVISFLEPWFLNRKLALGVDLYYSDNSYMSDYYTQQNYGFSVSLRKALDDKQNLKLTYTLEQYSLDPENNAPVFFRDNCGDFTRSNIRLAYEYDTRDAMITPRKGGHFEAFGSWSGPGSTVETYSVGIAGSYYYNSVWDSIWSVNFGVETIDTVNSDEAVPLFEKCFLGGPNNLRGFRYHDVGLVDSSIAGDESMGGNTSAFVQFELSLPVVDSMRFATFVDVGFVNGDSFDFDTGHISADYGIGLRLNLPKVPVAVDYAIPFKTGNAVDRNGQFQFYIDYKY